MNEEYIAELARERITDERLEEIAEQGPDFHILTEDAMRIYANEKWLLAKELRAFRNIPTLKVW